MWWLWLRFPPSQDPKKKTVLPQMFGQRPLISLNDCGGQRISLEPPKPEIWLRQCQRDIKCLFTHSVKLKTTASTENCREGPLEVTKTNEENNTVADLEQTHSVCQRVCRWSCRIYALIRFPPWKDRDLISIKSNTWSYFGLSNPPHLLFVTLGTQTETGCIFNEAVGGGQRERCTLGYCS